MNVTVFGGRKGLLLWTAMVVGVAGCCCPTDGRPGGAPGPQVDARSWAYETVLTLDQGGRQTAVTVHADDSFLATVRRQDAESLDSYIRRYVAQALASRGKEARTGSPVSRIELMGEVRTVAPAAVDKRTRETQTWCKICWYTKEGVIYCRFWPCEPL